MLLTELTNNDEQVAQLPKFVFHVTFRNPKATNILTHGLIPNLTQGETKEKIFLVPSLDDARSLAKVLYRIDKTKPYKTSKYCIIRIKSDELNQPVYFDTKTTNWEGMFVYQPIPSSAFAGFKCFDASQLYISTRPGRFM